MIISRTTTFLRHLMLFIPLFALLSDFAFAAPPLHRITRHEYIERYKSIAIDHQQRFGIPASITMAQGILESDSGNSILSRGSNNHFGIKCKSNWKGRTYTYTDDAPDECFRAYDRVEQSYEDHANFLDGSIRYDSLFRFSPTDYRSWARGLKNAGYATARDYTARLVKIIEDEKLYLLDTEAEDGVKAYDELMAKRPAQVEEQPAMSASKIDPNNFQVAVGRYSGYGIYMTNKTRFVRAKSGDTYRSIAKSFGISKGAMSKNNDTSNVKEELEAGSVVYIDRKQKSWRGNVREHRVLPGETVRSVSQAYAIREKSLRKMNKMDKDDEFATGAIVYIQ